MDIRLTRSTSGSILDIDFVGGPARARVDVKGWVLLRLDPGDGAGARHFFVRSQVHRTPGLGAPGCHLVLRSRRSPSTDDLNR